MALPKAQAKKKVSTVVPRDYDKTQLGEEPKFFDNMPEGDRDIVVIQTFNWYNYFFTQKELKQDLIEYAKTELKFKADELKCLRASDDYVAKNSAGSYVRMIRNGWKANDRELNVIKDNLSDLLASGIAKMAAKTPEPEKEKTTQKKLNPQQFIEDKFNTTIGVDLFDLETQWVEGKYETKFDAYALIQKHEIKGSGLNHVSNWVKPRLEEFEAALSGDDADLKEAYSHMKKTEIKAVIKTLKGIISDVEKSKQTQKANRSVRKKAKPSVDKLLTQFQFKKEDSELKIASINPAMIVGAKRLVVVNTKYNMLTEFIAESREGLSVKQGTSYIENYSTQDSRTVTIPKKFMAECVEAVQSKTQRQFNNYIKNTLKRKDQKEFARRINKDTIILKVE